LSARRGRGRAGAPQRPPVTRGPPRAAPPQAERYDEMVEEMQKVAKMVHDQELSVEERNLLSVAYKNVIGARRASWRIISSIEQKEESKGNEEHVNRIKKYRQVVGGGRGGRQDQGPTARPPAPPGAPPPPHACPPYPPASPASIGGRGRGVRAAHRAGAPPR
jgi:hypothetical protein